MSGRLAEYLARIGLAGVAPVTLGDSEGLAVVQRAHRQAIGFENLDIVLGRGIAIDADSAFAKLIGGGRGGYCFEHNRVFSDMLGTLGLSNRPLLARVRLGLGEDSAISPRSHVLLLVDVAGEPWIADAGFGASYVPPLPLRDGAEARTPDGARHRLRLVGAIGDMGGQWLLERAGPVSATDGRASPHENWQGQYGFDLGQVAPVDLEQANHWTSTRAGTRFTGVGIVSIVLPDGFAAMTGRRVSVYRGGVAKLREIGDAGEMRRVLREVFRIAVGEDEAGVVFEKV